MKKLLFFISILMLSTNLQAKEWYEQEGTLHQSTMKEWCEAEHSNKLVTAGDFISLSFKENMFKPELMQAINQYGLQGIKVMAEQIVTALDESSCEGKKANKDLATMKVSNMASMSMILMEWIGKD